MVELSSLASSLLSSPPSLLMRIQPMLSATDGMWIMYSLVHRLLLSLCPILYDTCGTNTLTVCSPSCKFRVNEGATHCQNRTCPTVTSGGFASEPHYSILISLSDHTGGIDGVRLSGQPASDLLQQTVGKLKFLVDCYNNCIPINNVSSCMATYNKTPCAWRYVYCEPPHCVELLILYLQ